jgi:sec-independent protein translocase protein TatB
MVPSPQIELSTIGWADSLILMVLALVVFGPRRLPLIGKQIGKLMYEFRKASNDFKFQMEEELRLSEEADRRKKEEEERQRALAAAASPAPEPVSAPAPASPYPGEGTYPTQYSPETPTAAPIEIPYPRIQPPSTGEQVVRQISATEAPVNQVTEVAIATNADPGQEAKSVEPSPVPAEAPPAADESPRTEPVSHHG